MNFDRRTLLQSASMAAALVPLTAGQSAAASAPPMAHPKSMQEVFGAGMHGTERIAMLVYPGFTALDLVGPHHFFGGMMGAKIDLVTTEADLGPVKSDFSLPIAPNKLMSDVGEGLDILFIPGGGLGTANVMKRAEVIDFVAKHGASAKLVTSVCTGSMVLAKAGLLKGKRATSHWAVRPMLERLGALPVDSRIVADGNVISAAGISAGIDFGISVVAKLRGANYAKALMLQAEYAPEPPFAGGTLVTTDPEIGAMMNAYNDGLRRAFSEAILA